MHFLFGFLMVVTSGFLILLILIQRGRGGGLTGALGGMGGQSAFGTKAGDVFTRVTIVTATIWILVGMASIAVLNRGSGPLDASRRSVSSKTDNKTDKTKTTDDAKDEMKPSPEKPAPSSSGSTGEAEKPADGDNK